MKIPSFVKAIVSPREERPPATRPHLNVGDRLVGRVLELKGDRRAVVDFGRFRALSDLGFPVKKGDVIHVKVTDNGVPLRLKRYGAATRLEARNLKNPALRAFPSRDVVKDLQTHLRQCLSDTRPQMGRLAVKTFYAAMENLLSQFEPVRLKQPVSEISARIKQYMENSGIFYEKKLEKIVSKFMQVRADPSVKHSSEMSEIKQMAQRDGKPSLLILRDFLAGKEGLLKALGSHDREGLRQAVEKLLAETTARQTDSGLKPLRSDTVQVFTYLMPMKELEQDARVKVYYPRKREPKSQEGFKISLLLTMEKIGPIRTDLYLRDRHLSVDFFVTEPGVADHADGHLNELRQALEDAFDGLSLRVVLSEEKVEEFEFEDLTLSSDGLIDVKV